MRQSLLSLIYLAASTYAAALPYEPSLLDNKLLTRDTKDHKFLSNKTKPFAVDGANLPDIPFDIGESYSGLIPIDETSDRELFFWFVPSDNPAADDEILIWLNGGPGCSSLMGFLQENGPFSWQTGTYVPVPNSFSWSNLTNVVWVEQPVGTGFSTGSKAHSQSHFCTTFTAYMLTYVSVSSQCDQRS
jgi:carboxypeptidase D